MSYQTSFGYKFRSTNSWYAIRLFGVEFMIAPKRNPLKPDNQSSRCRPSQILNSKCAINQCTRGCLCLKKLKFAFTLTFFSAFCGKKMSERATNSTLPARNTLIQLLFLYTDRDSHNTQRSALQTDRRTDMMMPIANQIVAV